MEKEWYGNKELFEMLNGFKKEVSDLRLEMRETKTLIRDYNGLRQNINEVNKKVGEMEKELLTSTNNRKEYIGYIIAAISILFALLTYLR